MCRIVLAVLACMAISIYRKQNKRASCRVSKDVIRLSANLLFTELIDYCITVTSNC